MISNNNTLQERNITKIKSLKHIKRQFFSTHLILPKPFGLCSGTRIFGESKNKNKNNIKSHKNTISEISSVNSVLNNHSKRNNSNSNTTANTHKNSNKKNNSNSFKKCKINLKTLTRKNSSKINNYLKIKRPNICPVRKIINRNNNNISIAKEESKNNSNNNYSFLSKIQFHYDIKSLQKENNISSNRNPE